MKTFEKSAAQGDCLLVKIESLPSGIVLQNAKDDQHVLAHSETGHHHVMDSDYVDYYKSSNDPFISYVHVKEGTPIKHLRGFDTHESLFVSPGIYEVRRAREFWLGKISLVVD